MARYSNATFPVWFAAAGFAVTVVAVALAVAWPIRYGELDGDATAAVIVFGLFLSIVGGAFGAWRLIVGRRAGQRALAKSNIAAAIAPFLATLVLFAASPTMARPQLYRACTSPKDRLALTVSRASSLSGVNVIVTVTGPDGGRLYRRTISTRDVWSDVDELYRSFAVKPIDRRSDRIGGERTATGHRLRPLEKLSRFSTLSRLTPISPLHVKCADLLRPLALEKKSAADRDEHGRGFRLRGLRFQHWRRSMTRHPTPIEALAPHRGVRTRRRSRPRNSVVPSYRPPHDERRHRGASVVSRLGGGAASSGTRDRS